jgi:hypothetical protein
MATETITRTLAGETEHPSTGESLYTEGSGRGLGSVPFGASRLGSSQLTERQI